MILSPVEAESYVASAIKWLLVVFLGCLVSVLLMLAMVDNNFEVVDQSFERAIHNVGTTCTDQPQANALNPEQVRGRAPGLSGEGLYTRQTEAWAERTLDPPRLQKPPRTPAHRRGRLVGQNPAVLNAVSLRNG
jgi:hypothetical protein